ncbi:MAG: hypothetical protein NTV60_01565 [Candidatus Kaiserbacteria bacterium]|nr:hypothetical protein [Candidatus Kaiserbacteria bacterium]
MLRSRGISLVEVVVSIGLFLVLFLALFGILRSSLVLSSLTKAKASAVELANTQMEYLHGMSYSSIGTVGGIPAGTVPQTATTTIDGVNFVVRTYVEYYDDPADGLGVSDTNHITTDYKKGKVAVSYRISGLTKQIILFSNFVPLGIESATNGGLLSIHAVDATGANLSDATVQIINAATSPSVNFSTFTDMNGLVTIDGAATSSQYQIYVSRTGYSSAQTYARDSQNANPTPGYLTVVKNQTTTGTFAIDRLSTLTLSSFSPAVTTAFSDTFTSSANLSNQVNTQVTGGVLLLTSQMLSGSARSIPIIPSSVNGWGILSATTSTPTGTSLVVRVEDAGGTPLPDSVLTGNSAGFSSFPVSLTSIPTASYPGLALEATLTSNSTTTTPSLLDWSLTHTDAPAPLPNAAFTLTGTKTIGSTSGGAPIYKTVVNDTTSATSTKTELLEWDAYSIRTTLPLIESCMPAPYSLPPATTTAATIIVGATTATTLPVFITNTAGNGLPHAKVVLTRSGYAATVFSSACGISYFNGLSAGTYTATVTASGYENPKVFPNIVVSGHTATSTLSLP